MANDTLAADTLGAMLHTSAGDDQLGGDDGRDLAAAVQSMLDAFLCAEATALEATDPALGAFARVARETVLAGGKRLRPTFAHWGWRGVVGPDAAVDGVLGPLAALELLHTFALVHDDVMDGSATRRGRPTAHEVFAAQHAAAGRLGDPDRFGTAAAVLAGDLCLVWADRLVAAAAVPADVLLEARRCYDQMRVETIAGQYLDVLGEAEATTWSVDRALRVARLKTASYTVVRPMLFGAALGGDAFGAQPAYTAYGTAVGEAFQLCDDLLGVFGDPAVTGKPAGDDLRTGKPTVLLLLARQLAGPAARAELDRIGPAVDVDRLAEVVRDTGAVSAVESMIDHRVEAARAALAGAPIDPSARDALEALAIVATHRRS